MSESMGIEKVKCRACTGGQIEIPHWYEDVESWETVLVPCPVCGGVPYKTRDEWGQRAQELREPKRPLSINRGIVQSTI